MNTFLFAGTSIAVDASSSGYLIEDSSSLTISHTTGNGSDRLMLVGVSVWNKDEEKVSSITYGGSPLIKVGDKTRKDDARVEIWQLIAPASGTNNVVITFNRTVKSDRGAVAGVMTFVGVEQNNPLDTMMGNDGDSDTASVSVVSVTDDLVFSVMAAKSQTAQAVTSPSVIERWNQKPSGGSERVAGAGATDDGASSVSFSWALADDKDWAVAGVSINPSSSSGSSSTSSTACSAFWPGGLQNTDSGGKIKFEDKGQLISNPNNVLQTTSLTLEGSVTSCYTQACTSSNSVVAAVTPGAFQTTSVNHDVIKDSGENFVLGSDATNEYREIKLKKSAGTLSDSGNYSEYKLDQLTLEEDGNWILNAGSDYWIKDLTLKKNVTVTVSGNGTARLYIKNSVTFDQDVLMNSPSKGVAGDASKLFIYAYDDIEIDEDATVSAVIHSEGDFKLKEKAFLFGAVSAKKKIEIKNQVTFDATAVAQLSLGSLCGDETPPATEQPASNFNCVYNGLDAATGKLYTRVVGTAFNFDVAALDASNVVETNYAADADRSVTVELVDTSGGGSCSALPALSPAVSQTLTFTSSDAGRKASANMTVNKAYSSVGCRVTDATDSPSVVGCSSDSFAIKPSGFTLTVPSLTNSTASGLPIAKAGDLFSLNVTSVAGYNGTPSVSGSLEAHSGAINVGTLAGTFSASDPATGIASGNAFTYSEVGNFRFLANAIRDVTFTAVDQNSDCIAGSSSNTLSSGKVGCDVGNASVSDWIGRFVPDHFAVSIVDHGALSNACVAGKQLGFFGTDIPFSVDPSVTITAQNGIDNATTTNYTGASYGKLQVGDISMPAITGDGTTNGVDGVTKVGLTWHAGTPSLSNNNGVMTFALSGDTFTYSRGANDLVAPFVADVNLIINSMTDSDGVTASGLPQTISPTGIDVRFARLNLLNAYGSELQTLPMTLQMEYYNGSANGFVPHTTDNCTIINNIVITEADASDSLVPSETCIWDSAGNSGSNNCATAGAAADQYSPVPVASNFNLNLMGPGSGNTGTLSVTADAPPFLEFDWLGAGNVDPTASVTFGIHNRNSKMIFFKEVR